MIEFFRRKKFEIPPERLAKEQERMRIESERIAEIKKQRDAERAAAKLAEYQTAQAKEATRRERIKNISPEHRAALEKEKSDKIKRIAELKAQREIFAADKKPVSDRTDWGIIEENERRIAEIDRELGGEG